ncbi:MAG TPA: dienelactone hydrolase family protein [Blastocatellia bacterium]|nr:dienelactone hydrolase family protein [Blastocatellia bacterium]
MGVEGREVEFQVSGKTVRGYLAAGEGAASQPGLILVHEWWGLNEHVKDLTRRFAGEGYVVLAPDLYDGASTKDPDEAGKLMQGLDKTEALEKLDGAVAYLQGLPAVDKEKIGVTGFCMGGTYALLLAAHNTSVKASAPFYGDVPTDDELKHLSAPVLFIGAENDFWITKEKMDRLDEGLKKHGKEGEVKVYEGVGHAFFNDTRPEAYDKDAAEDAWRRVTSFFAENLKSAAR